MGLFKSKEEKVAIKAKKVEEKAAKKAKKEEEKQEFKARHGKQSAYMSGKYIGGSLPFKANEDIEITCYENDIILRASSALWNHNNDIVVPYTRIDPFTIKTEEQIRRDVTLTRMLLVGIFAFGLKKKRVTKNQYLVFYGTDETNSEMKGILEIGKLASMNINLANETRKKFLINHPQKIESKETATNDDPMEQIKKLAKLKDSGIISEEEFINKKKELLSRI